MELVIILSVKLHQLHIILKKRDSLTVLLVFLCSLRILSTDTIY